jgi:hypothetical protein
VPTKPARSICILGDDNIGRMSDAQQGVPSTWQATNSYQAPRDHKQFFIEMTSGSIAGTSASAAYCSAREAVMVQGVT